MDDKNFGGNDQNGGFGSGNDFNGFLGGDSLGGYDGGNNDFNSGNSFGGNNDFNSGSSFGGNNDFNSGNSFGGNNDFNSGSSFGGNNDFNSGSSFGSGMGGNSFGGQGMNAPQDNYDPNAMFSDQSSSLYGSSPSASFSAPTRTATAATGNKTKVIAALLLIVIAIAIAVYIIIQNNKTITFREWAQTSEGRSFISKMQTMADTKYGDSDYTINISVKDDDKLLMMLRYKTYQELSQSEIDFIKSYTESAMKEQKKSLAKEIKKIKNECKIENFSIVYEMHNANGDFLYDIVVQESDMNG